MADRGDTRKRMIETAARLFQERGYEATSWRTLVDEARTPWGSVQHHFPEGKEQLGEAAVEYGAQAVAETLEAVLTESPTPAAAIQRWCKLSAEQLEQSDFVYGCPVATVALETFVSSPRLAKACSEAFERWREILIRHFVAAGIKRARAAELAVIAHANFEGAMLLARTSRSSAPLRLVGEQLSALLAAETGEKRPLRRTRTRG